MQRFLALIALIVLCSGCVSQEVAPRTPIAKDFCPAINKHLHEFDLVVKNGMNDEAFDARPGMINATSGLLAVLDEIESQGLHLRSPSDFWISELKRAMKGFLLLAETPDHQFSDEELDELIENALAELSRAKQECSAVIS